MEKSNQKIMDEQVSEAELQASIVKLATLLGYEHFHTLHSQGSDAGWPDLILAQMGDDPYNPPTKKGIQSIDHSWVKPRQIIIEVKREGQSPTNEQFWWLEFYRLRRAEVYVVWPSDISSGFVERILKGEDVCDFIRRGYEVRYVHSPVSVGMRIK